MKRILIVLILIIPTLLLSGCSLKSSGSKNDGGVYKSEDFGEHWEHKIFVAQEAEQVKTIGSLDANFIAFDPKEENKIYLSTYGSGIFRSDNGGNNWNQTSLSGGTFTSMAIDSLNNKVLYVTGGTKIIKTVDDMLTWHDIYIEKRPNQQIVSLVINPNYSNIIYAATTSSLIKSTDYGNSWQLLDWQEKPKILQQFISAKNTNVLYIITEKGIYKSTTAGREWFDISGSLSDKSNALTVQWADFDPLTEYIYISTKAGIFRSLDGGNSWQEITTLFDFKKIPIKTIVHNPSNTNEILFTVDNVIYKTTDGGRTWSTIKSVPTSRLINVLAVDPYDSENIYLGTLSPNN